MSSLLERRDELYSDISTGKKPTLLETIKTAGIEIPPTDPIRAPAPMADTYPVDALGEILGNAVKSLHKDTKAPLALCAQSVLASASLAAQAHFDVALPWGQRKPLAVFILTVGLSGERKSAIDEQVTGAAEERQEKDMVIYEQDLIAYKQELEQWKTENDKRNKKGVPKSQAGSDYSAADAYEAMQEPEAPIHPLRLVEDPTAEGLYKLLENGQPSVGLFTDEGAQIIGGHALSKDNALKSMAMWCKLWDGSSISRVRAGDGVSVLYRRRMTINIQAQPEVMSKLLNDPMANGQGFLARCLVAWPESTIGSRHIEAFANASQGVELSTLHAKLKGLHEAEPRVSEHSKQELNPVELSLDDDAKLISLSAYNQFETLMKSGNDLCELTDRASKALENACRIAGILAVIDDGMATRSIKASHITSGLILMQWYLAESLRIKSMSLIPIEVKHAEMLIKWLDDRQTRLFSSVMVLQKAPNQIRSKARLDPAIKVLIESGHIEQNDPNTLIEGKKTRTSWRVLSYVV
jgi:putative DNA primase/helicase